MVAARTIAKLNNNLLYLVQGRDRLGREAFYYVLVDNLKRHLFLKEVGKESRDLRQYGKILISGFGHEPTSHAKAYLKNKFGIGT